MNSPDFANIVIAALNDLGVPYMVVGSLSSNVYGIERSTIDADFVIETDDRVRELVRHLEPAFRADPQIAFETVTMTTKYLMEHRETGFRVELFVLSDDAHDRERFRRRVKLERDGFAVWLPTAEDVVIQKVRWARAKDMLDARDVIAVSGDGLDWPYIEGWCDRLGCRDALEMARAEAWDP